MAAPGILPCVAIVSATVLCHFEDWDFVFSFLHMYPPYFGYVIGFINDSDDDLLKFLLIFLDLPKLIRMLDTYWTDPYASLTDLKKK